MNDNEIKYFRHLRSLSATMLAKYKKSIVTVVRGLNIIGVGGILLILSFPEFLTVLCVVPVLVVSAKICSAGNRALDEIGRIHKLADK